MLEAEVPAPPGEEHLTELALQAVDELVGGLEAQVAYSPEANCHRDEESRSALRRLRVLVHLRDAVRELESAAARDAAVAGAGYPQIGEASHMSRQGARRRWPGLMNDSARSYPTFVPRSTKS